MNRPSTPSGPRASTGGTDPQTEHESGPDSGPDAQDAGLVRALRAITAPARPPHLPEGDVSYALHETPVGTLVLAVGAGGRLLASSYDGEEAVTARVARAVSPRVLRRPRALDEVRAQLDEYFAGRRRTLDVTVDLALATPFARRVLHGLAGVPYASTTTYGELATAIGAPRASRAVGSALGANPVCVVVPCHRVVRSDGAVGGYAGGPASKEALLHLERSASAQPGRVLGAVEDETPGGRGRPPSVTPGVQGNRGPRG